MSIPRDIKDRTAKRLLRHRRMIRDLLAFLPRAWIEDVDLRTLRELPAEYIGAKGHRRVGDILWLADRAADRQLLLMFEHQSRDDARMAARTAAQTGLLYTGLSAQSKDADGLFPALLPVVVHAGRQPWRAAVDLAETVAPSAIPIGIRGPAYLPLDLQRIASEHPSPTNRFSAWAGVTFPSRSTDAVTMLKQTRDLLDMSDEDDQRLLSDLIDWHYAQDADRRPEGWNPDEARGMEEIMRELTGLEIHAIERAAFLREEGKKVGKQEGIELGVARQRNMLVRQAAHRFGPDIGRRLANTLGSVSDPVVFDKASDLILDCDNGEQLLNDLNGTP